MTWLDNVFMVSNYKSCSVHPDPDPRLTTLVLRTNKFDWKNMYLLQNHGNLINLFLKSRQLTENITRPGSALVKIIILISTLFGFATQDWTSVFNKLFACWIYLHFVLIQTPFCRMMSFQIRTKRCKWLWLPDCKTIHQKIIYIWTMQNWIRNAVKSVCELFKKEGWHGLMWWSISLSQCASWLLAVISTGHSLISNHLTSISGSVRSQRECFSFFDNLYLASHWPASNYHKSKSKHISIAEK